MNAPLFAKLPVRQMGLAVLHLDLALRDLAAGDPPAKAVSLAARRHVDLRLVRRRGDRYPEPFRGYES